ncbi:MAG: hypothetical protein ACRC2K_08350 [Clostridium sp.]
MLEGGLTMATAGLSIPVRIGANFFGGIATDGVNQLISKREFDFNEAVFNSGVGLVFDGVLSELGKGFKKLFPGTPKTYVNKSKVK